MWSSICTPRRVVRCTHSLQTIQHTPASKKLVEWMNKTSRPRPTAAEAAQGMSDFIRAIRFESTVHDAKLEHILR
jgi:hypothetical protein